MIMATLTKLLLMRIVASRRSLFAKRPFILVSEECFSSSISFISEGDRLKKAISEAETKPEQKRSRMPVAKAIHAPVEGMDVWICAKESVRTEISKFKVVCFFIYIEICLKHNVYQNGTSLLASAIGAGSGFTAFGVSISMASAQISVI